MADLVQQVKDIQRNDPDGKQAYIKYCDEYGNSVRDPAKHDAAFLQYFVQQYNSGAYAGMAATVPAGFSGGKGDGKGGGLAELFKEGQRGAPNFKEAWSTFQSMNGGMGDPHKAGKDTLVSFLEFACQQTIMNMKMLAPMGMMGGKGCGKGEWGGNAWGGEPMAKKPRVPVSTGNPAKDVLVEKIKTFQRSSEANKEAWGAFCAEHGNIRDPARHEEHVLQVFITGYGIQ